MGVSGPEVIVKEVDGKLQEPYENVVFDIEEEHQGSHHGASWSTQRRND